MFINKCVLCIVIFVLTSCTSLPDIGKTNSKNLGPWLTIQGDPQTSIDITWLTEERIGTGILFGTDRKCLQDITIDLRKKKLHRVSLTDLLPGTTYYYSVNKEILSFQTVSDTPADYTISVIGDLQPFKKQSRKSNELMSRAIVNQDPDLVVQLGDVSESGGISFLLSRTLRNISGYASHIPFMAAPGNHDYYTKGNGNFRNLFPYDYPSENELYHSLNYKNSTLFFLDVHLENQTISPDQQKWFEENLKSAAGQKNQWIFVFVHDIVMATGSTGINWELQKWLVPLADTYGIDAVFFGHSHNYEHWNYQYGKSGLVHSSDDSPTGEPVHYFCAGGGGADLKTDRFIKREDRVIKSYWEELSGSGGFTLSAQIKGWNPDNYIDWGNNPVRGAPPERKNYYHLPEKENYSGYNRIFGYEYGERTHHYINISFSGPENEICTISVHYPDGVMLKGPDNNYPQIWVMTKNGELQ